MTAIENKQYGMAAAYFGGMLAEQALTALTFGQGTAAQNAVRTAAQKECGSIATTTGETAEALWKLGSHKLKVISNS
jgi:hypothetical protein